MDLAEHDYRVKSIGLTRRALKIIIRVALITLPVIALIYWYMKSSG